MKKENKKKKNLNEDFSIRSINLKLSPTEEHAKLLDKDFTMFRYLHDIGVNRYSILSNPSNDTLAEEAKKMIIDLQSYGCTGTFVDLAVGKGGAESYFRTIRKMAKDDIIRKDKEVKRIEKHNANLIKLKSIWFDPIKKIEGKCSMCEIYGEILWKSNEYDEYLCEACMVDFFAYRDVLKHINRYVKKNYFLCKELLSDNRLSESLIKEIKKQYEKLEGQSYIFENTVSNRVKLKVSQLKIDFDKNITTMSLSDGEKIQIQFSGNYYYNNFPRYGKNSNEYNFKRLIKDFIEGKGYASLIRKNKNGEKEYYLSIPTHYPMFNKEKKVELVEGCILVSQRKVLIYINGKAKFIELFNPYIKKRIYGYKNKEIQKQNAYLCLCDWNKIPKKNHMLLRGLKKKLGFDWINDHNVIVTKSEDGNNIVIKDDNDDKRKIELTINRNTGIGELKSVDHEQWNLRKLYIVEKKVKEDKIYNDENSNEHKIDRYKIDRYKIDRYKIDKYKIDKYRRLDIYIEPQIPMPKKYSGGNLLKYIRHKNKETARQIVEEAKKLLSDKGSILLIDYKGMHPEGEGIVPMMALNYHILNMLKYDSIYGGSINWSRLKKLICPNCHKVLPLKGEDGKRFIIKDIFLSDIRRWVCEEGSCNKKINSPLIAVCRHIMNSNLEELLRKPTKKEMNNV